LLSWFGSGQWLTETDAVSCAAAAFVDVDVDVKPIQMSHHLGLQMVLRETTNRHD